MKIFLSFAEGDHRLIHVLSGILAEAGIDVLVATKLLSPGMRLDEKVKSMIGKAHCVLVILTPKSLRSHWVQQEIGCAKALGKHIVPLKTGITRLPAMLDGVEYFKFKPSDPASDFQRVSGYLCKYADKKRLKRRRSMLGKNEDFEVLHLPHAMLCPKCKNVDVHVFLCLLCGQWVCHACGGTVPPDARAVKKT